MSAADPGWLATAGAIGTAFGAAFLAIWQGRKPKSEGEGENKVVASSLFASQPIRDLTTAITNLDTTVRANTALHERLHDLEERDDLAELKAQLRILGKRSDEAL